MTWTQSSTVRRFDLVPIKWVGAAYASQEAFASAFGMQAQRCDYMLFRMRVANLGSMGT